MASEVLLRQHLLSRHNQMTNGSRGLVLSRPLHQHVDQSWRQVASDFLSHLLRLAAAMISDIQAIGSRFQYIKSRDQSF